MHPELTQERRDRTCVTYGRCVCMYAARQPINPHAGCSADRRSAGVCSTCVVCIARWASMCEFVFSPCLIFQSVQTRGRLTASHTLSLLRARPSLSVSCVMDDRGGKITNSTVDLHCSGWMARPHNTKRGPWSGRLGKHGKSSSSCLQLKPPQSQSFQTRGNG